MFYRPLNNTDVRVSAVVLGTWAIGGWLWGGADDANALAAIQRAIDLGMTSIDTAPVYGFGHSESLVGQAIAGRRDKVQILTKYGLCWDVNEGEPFFETQDEQGRHIQIYKNARKERVIRECEESLKRLGTDYIDLYQCHWRDPVTPLEETMAAVDQLLKDGKILSAGVSNYTPEEMDICRKIVPLASDQPPYSMLRRDIEKDVLPYCRQNNLAVTVYSPLQLGLLSGKVSVDHEYPANDQRAHSPYFRRKNRQKVLEFLGSLRPIADAHDATLAQLVINWTIHRPGITATLVGARNATQAEENAAAAGFELTADETQQIDQKLESVKLELEEASVASAS